MVKSEKKNLLGSVYDSPTAKSMNEEVLGREIAYDGMVQGGMSPVGSRYGILQSMRSFYSKISTINPKI